MNEHINELISAYLHGGCTSEQEKELFAACNTNPEFAGLLRSQIMLSLELRALRNQVQVPDDLRNNVLHQINSAQHQREVTAKNDSLRHTVSRRFCRKHFIASAVTAAAAIWMLFFFEQNERNTVQLITDTVHIVQHDTIIQVHKVPYLRYITGIQGKHKTDEEAIPRNTTSIELDIATTPMVSDQKSNDLIEDQAYSEPQLQAKLSSYLQQYNDMLLSVETIHLTGQDRITQ